MNNLKLTIIIITYNAAEYIGNCIISLLKQVYAPFDILIIDNDSSDGTKEIINSIINQKDNIYFIENNTNLGFSKACNIGIKYAFSKLDAGALLFLNQDTIIQNNLLSELISWYNKFGDGAYCPKILIKKNHSIWWVGTKFLRLQDLIKNNSLSVSYHVDKEMDDTLSIKYPVEIEAITGCALFLPKKIIDEIGFFDEKFFMYAEDLDYSIRLRKKGYKMYIIPNTVVYHDVPLKDEALQIKNNILKTLKRYYHHFMSSLILLNKHYTLLYITIWLLRVPFAVINEIIKRIPFRKSGHPQNQDL
jgi:GT2 family glycosyltransferase